MESDFRSLRVAVAQPMAIPGDVQENTLRARAMIAEAGAADASVIAFSECSLTGYDLDNKGVEAAISADDPALDDMSQAARDHGLAVIVGYYEKADGEVFNSAHVLFPDGTRLQQRKHMIIAHEADHTVVRKGPRNRLIFEIGGIRCGILICADSGIPEIFEEMASLGVELVFLITAGCGRESWGFHQEDLQDPDRLNEYLKRARTVCFPESIVRRAVEYKLSVACCNQMGWVPGTGFFHPGHSFLADYTGEIKAMIPGRFVFEHLRPELAVAEVTVRAATDQPVSATR